MSGNFDAAQRITRRKLLKGMGLAPLFLRPAPLMLGQRWLPIPLQLGIALGDLHADDIRYIPHDHSQSDIAAILKLVPPGSDEYVTERYATAIEAALASWGNALKVAAPATQILAALLAESVEATPWQPVRTEQMRSGFGISVQRHHYAPPHTQPREQFLQEIHHWLSAAQKITTAEFEVYSIHVLPATTLTVETIARYDLVMELADGHREERVGDWKMAWSQPFGGAWQMLRWEALGETVSTGSGPGFVDVTEAALGGNASYKEQLMYGVDYWRTVLDSACGTDIYANNGVAAGDYDNDGFDDLYVCQPAGLPNRLYRNRGDGTFEDVTEKAGVGLLDNTACALFVDFDNRGLQDLLIVCGSGPLLFQNRGDGTFVRKQDAFHFAQTPQGAFTHAAVADYDGDGRLDIYFCTYSYYLGLDQYHYPAPYYDARNGPPNILMHNEGNGRFVETTKAAGLDIDNNRYSFACAWGDANNSGHPDLCIANDFGTSQLYRNNGDGTFSVASATSHIEDVGAGMSACWCDFNNDGHQDIYITSMWEAAGQRVSEQPQFHAEASSAIRAKYQRHARGNALYRNNGDGTFTNAGQQTNTAMGRWSWSADFWDVDHDGYPDLYVSNGYISAEDPTDVASFFWRQVVAKSPEDATPLHAYERGWNAINELVRSDRSWNSYERNILFINNRDGSFSEASGVLGLDCIEDGRAFALADIDRDGRLEVILKNRNAPQVRILRNELTDIGASISFRLRGRTSNRDAIGASILLECGSLRQTRYLQAGTGFLSQHSKELFFGLGNPTQPIHATVRWPSGIMQHFTDLPVGHLIALAEGDSHFTATPFTIPTKPHTSTSPQTTPASLPKKVETWLVAPLRAPDFLLPTAAGTPTGLKQYAGKPLILYLWSSRQPSFEQQLSKLQRQQASLSAANISVLTMNLGGAADALRHSDTHWSYTGLTTVFANEEIAGVYNILFRYLFDRQRDLALPTTFLINPNGLISKVYQGSIELNQLLSDVKRLPSNDAERQRLGLPFAGTLVQGTFQRNDFTYGVAMFQHGYVSEAITSFEQAIATHPDDPEAYYNLGTLTLRSSQFEQAKQYLQHAVLLRSDYPEAWNNLGMIAAEQGDTQTAIASLRKALMQRPEYVTAMLNLGNIYRRQHDFTQAAEFLTHAYTLEPDDPEANYSVGMLYAQQNELKMATQYLQASIRLRPDYLEAINNLGIVYVQLQEYPTAVDTFRQAIDVAPENEQAYLNLARLYTLENDRISARSTLQALLARQPHNTVALQAIEGLR
jgi:tetratricopeptide (TPR) repeat protein